MESQQLLQILRADPYTSGIQHGVLPWNDFPRRIPHGPVAYILNTDPCDRPGQHWVALYTDGNHFGDYFDSYGRPPFRQEIAAWLDRRTDQWEWNHQPLQSKDTTVCGQYCLYYLLQRARGHSMNFIVQTFKPSYTTYDNDLLVYDWADRMFGIRPPFYVP